MPGQALSRLLDRLPFGRGVIDGVPLAPPTHLPHRSAHLALLRAALDDDPARRPPLRAVQRALDDWLRSVGPRTGGSVTAAR